MSSNYAPQRRTLLALHHETSTGDTGLVVRSQTGAAAEAQRQLALSVPESVRALGEPLEPFFAACGGRQTISLSVIRRDGRTLPETCVFQQPFVLIGRCPESDLSLDDGAVSFRHFYLQLIGGRWLYVDMASISGLSSEKGKSTSGWFDGQRELTAGRYGITRVSDQPQTSSQPAMDLIVAPDHALPGFELELVNARSSKRARGIPRIKTSVTLIGASRQCDVWLRDDSVSRVHASLVLTPHGLWVVDLLGRDGVLVDGRRVYWKQVHDGNVIQIGRFRLRVRFGASPDAVPGKVESRPRARTRRARKPVPATGSMSERSVMKLVGQLAEMQTQFFEHSQLQTQLITEMLGHLGRPQQTSVRQDLARIEEIGRELDEIKSQLAQPAGATAQEAKARFDDSVLDLPIDIVSPAQIQIPAATPPATGPADSPQAVDRGPHPGQGTADTAPPPSRPEAATSIRAPGTREAKVPPQPPATSATATAEAHARLSQRMAHLARERNSRWRHILKMFGKKPRNATDE